MSEKHSEFSLTVLGARGSVPVSGPEYAEYGGSTSCYLVRAGRYSVLLDAGSGLVNAPASLPEPPSILLSHWHLDHLIGLGMYERLSMAGATTDLYVPALNEGYGPETLDVVFGSPYWPLELSAYAGDVHVHEMRQALDVGPMHISVVSGNHPGGCLAFRITCGDKSIAYVTDYEYEPISFQRLVSLCDGADVLLYDAQYDGESCQSHQGFGHSTPLRGIELMEATGASQLLLIHHDPKSTDEILRCRERELGRDGVRFAREGEVVNL